jgi:transcriptional regulator with XRE-family HTH domain
MAMPIPRPFPVSCAQPIEYDFSCRNPKRLLDGLRDLRCLRTDAELSYFLGVSACTISKIRSGKNKISAAVILRIHEAFGLPVSELRAMLESD